jgi:hypothetical protein
MVDFGEIGRFHLESAGFPTFYSPVFCPQDESDPLRLLTFSLYKLSFVIRT